MSFEQQIRDTFDRYATDTPAPSTTYATVLVGHRRSQRRRLAGALTVGLALAVAVPIAIAWPAPAPVSSDVASPTGFVPGPPRGSLADDAGFLAEVAEVPWGRGPDAIDPAIADRRVLFAGDVPAGRWVRVVAPVQGRWIGVWLTGPAGAEPSSLAPICEPDPVAGWQGVVSFGESRGTLVVLSEPDDAVTVSLRTEIGSDGIARRDYRPVATIDGAAVVELEERMLTTVDVRVTRDGRTVEGWATGG